MNDPKCIIFVGLPGTGKTTRRMKYLHDPKRYNGPWTVASTDDIIETEATRRGSTYSEIFKDYIKEADKIFWGQLKYAADSGDNIVVDRTNLTIKSRKKVMDFIISRNPRYDFRCVIFEPPEEKLWRERLNRPRKWIPHSLIHQMQQAYQPPTKEEGFVFIGFNAEDD